MKHETLNLPASTLVKRQKQSITKQINYDGIKCDLVIEIRHDDECGNNHNTFAITGTIYKAGRRNDNAFLTGGCIHDEIAKHAPELKHLIKWHGVTTNKPLYYVENTRYHARECSHEGKKPGDAVKFEEFLQFGTVPMTFSQKEKGWFKYLFDLQSRGIKNDVELLSVPYDGKDNYDFKPNFTFCIPSLEDDNNYNDAFFSGRNTGQWYQVPFNDHKKAAEYLAMFKKYKLKMIKKPTAYATAETPDIEAARRCALWEGATLKQLQSEKKLLKRLPALMEEFKNVIETFGFNY